MPFDRVVDVVVVGSGAAGLTAALLAAEGGCAVEILEKAQVIGGTSALSGGMPWVPLNAHMAECGVEDSREEALEYVRGLTQGREPDPRLLEVYVDRAAEAFAFIESHTALRYGPSRSFSDYFAPRPGGKPRARSMDVVPFALGQLGEWAGRIRQGTHLPMGLTQDELAGAGSAPDPRNVFVGHDGGAGIDLQAVLEQRRAAGLTTMGEGMVAGLLHGVVERGVTVTCGARAMRLIREGGAIVGVVVEQDGREHSIEARRGVVLASGGFEWNRELVRAFLGVPEVQPLSPPTNVGDGLVMALEAGAAVANMSVAYAFPVTYDGESTLDGAPLAILATPRQEPGCITVNRSGRRFVNEGVTYMDMGKTHRVYDPTAQTYPNASPVWMIFDEGVRNRLHIADLHPGEPTPSWVKEAPTVEALAAAIAVDAAALTDEVERFNRNAVLGSDPDFGRGTVWWEGWTTGGPTAEKSLAPIASAPFYAMPLYDGILGTAGGVRVDEHARVCSMQGGVIEGLYAAGNVVASLFGPAYPGGGSTLGPGITFGYIAGRHLGERAAP